MQRSLQKDSSITLPLALPLALLNLLTVGVCVIRSLKLGCLEATLERLKVQGEGESEGRVRVRVLLCGTKCMKIGVENLFYRPSHLQKLLVWITLTRSNIR